MRKAPFTQDAEHLAEGTTQAMGYIAANGSVHTGCTQHQRVCTQICVQICLHVLCERGLSYGALLGAVVIVVVVGVVVDIFFK